MTLLFLNYRVEEWGFLLLKSFNPETFIINHLETSSRPQYIALFQTTTDTTNDYLKWLESEHGNIDLNIL